MLQIYLHIAKHPQGFPTNDKKIFYVGLYLQGTAQQQFQPNIFASGQVPILDWDGNWELFVQELVTNFSPHNPFRDAQIHLKTLSMKLGDQLEFDTYTVMTGYNEAALF
jgi:hypothetical protein